jgi:hypothetical protein
MAAQSMLLLSSANSTIGFITPFPLNLNNAALALTSGKVLKTGKLLDYQRPYSLG